MSRQKDSRNRVELSYLEKLDTTLRLHGRWGRLYDWENNLETSQRKMPSSRTKLRTLLGSIHQVSVEPSIRCIWLRGVRSSCVYGQARTGMEDQAVGRELSAKCVRHRNGGAGIKGKVAVCVWCSAHRVVALIKCHGWLLLKPYQMAEFVGWHFFSNWSLVARKGETIKWP